MTRNITLLTSLSLCALALGACGKDKASDGNKGTAPTEAKAAPAEPSPANIASLALTIDVPKGSDVQDKTASAHFPTATIYANPTIFITGANEMFWKKDLAAQKAEIQKNPANPFKKFTKEEASEGGFHLEFELSSMVDPTKTLYGIHIRSTIGGKQFDCSTNTNSTAERDAAIKMCMTLRATK